MLHLGCRLISNFAPVSALPKPVAGNVEREPALAAKAALILTGFSAVVGQIVLLRELIVVFNGNEMSVGIMLATWLLWTAAGSSVASRIALSEANTRRAVAALNCGMALSLPLTIFALRASRSWFQTVPGELISPLSMMLSSLVCLSVFCGSTGALFGSAARMVKLECAVSARHAAGSAYMFEAVGSSIGGIVASILLLRLLAPFQIAAIVALLNLCMAAVLLLRPTRAQFAAIAGVAVLAAFPLLTTLAPRSQRAAQAQLWRGFHLLGSRDSIYGNLAVTETGEIRSIYSNGVLLANVPDLSVAEESVHYALLEHPAPRRVLLIGGGINGSIAEALKHPTVERIDYVELDPALIAMARQYLPAQSISALADPRVHVHFKDGRSYLRATEERFDAILVNVPDPQTAQLNRFYTVEFFRSARNHLLPGGVLALELRSSEETMSPDLQDFLRCMERTLQQVFPNISVIPGDTIHFFAAMEPGILSEDPHTLMSRLGERKIATQYVGNFIPFRMMPDRMDQVHAQLAPLAATPVNRDFKPIAYYLDMALWSTQFHAGWSRWFRAAAQIRFARLMAALLAASILLAALAGLIPARARRAPAAAAFSVTATGFTLMALQVLLLLAFQSIFGYVYHQLAILIGLGMAGIALGSWLGMRRSAVSRSSSCGRLAFTQFLLAVSAPALIGAISLLALLSAPVSTWIAAQCVFPALAAVSGMLGGYQFPLASAIYLEEGNKRRSLGTLYALDLLGGCAGALLLSTWLIPVFGFWRTTWLCATVNLAPTLLAACASLADQHS